MRLNICNKYTPFVILTLSIVLTLILVPLLQQGMFMDGIQYAVVSKNLAEGHGTFWFPFLSSSWESQGQNAFLEHPPLIYWLQSFFFRVFKGSFYSERIYCLCMVSSCIVFIIAIWRLITENNKRYWSFYWLPVLLWIIIPSVYWSFINNMQENTLSVFVLASVYFSLKAVINNRQEILFIVLSGICIFLATLCKGLPGLFPVVTIPFFYLILKNISGKRTLFFTGIQIAIPALIYLLLIKFNTEAKASLSFYLKERLLYRINGSYQVDNRLTVLWWLFTDLLVPIGFFVLMLIIYKIKKVDEWFVSDSETDIKKWMIFFLLIGLSGSVPLCLTHVQRAVYFVPALPFFAFVFALVCMKGMRILFEYSMRKTFYTNFKYFSIVTMIAVLWYSFSVRGNIYRDEEILKDVHKLANVLEPNAVIGVPYNIYDVWNYQFYLLRYHNITLDPFYEKSFQYKMFEKERIFNDTMYNLMPVELETYKIYKRRN